MAPRSPRTPPRSHETLCLGCCLDVSERDERGLCPECVALRALHSEHHSRCDCMGCTHWAAVDVARAALEAADDEDDARRGCYYSALRQVYP